MTAERIGERSAKLVSFLDLAGHSKYQRTTLHGLTGYSPHYAMLVVSGKTEDGRAFQAFAVLIRKEEAKRFVRVDGISTMTSTRPMRR
ncbi:jg22559 [Pararge aegeria aegeria]|uniref:Jg22559 protein n=1 Tax=Pararge aegeria aegeria TaxID=348720 RepID=A0A8S4QI87_9NEOP|nr:jg22559 [Pararge aegeria aegeria]